jgi:dUTP pyrophosphatase
MANIKISIMRVEGSDDKIALPSYETIGAVGMDLRANFKKDLRVSGITLNAGQRALIPTGLALALPNGFEAQIRPRSGLALKKGVSIVNSPGTVDWDYRGEISVVIINHGAGPFDIMHGDRIAQIVFAPVIRAMFSVVDKLDETKRGSGGYGSTGQG